MTLTKQVMLSCSILFFAITVFLFSTLIYTASEGGQKEVSRASQESMLLIQNILGQMLQSKEGEKKLPVITQALLETGLYRYITIIDHDGNVILSKYSSSHIPNIPDWFVNSLQQSPHQKSDLVAQHNKLMLQGYSIDIIAHPTFAYRYLWYLFIACVSSLCIAYVLCLLLLKTLLNKLLHPLNTIYEQIDHVGTPQFTEIKSNTSTIEIKKIIQSLNSLSQKIKKIMDAEVLLGRYFRKQIHIDPITGLWNRAGFEEEADQFVYQFKNHNYIHLIVLHRNQEPSGQNDDETSTDSLKKISLILQNFLKDNTNYYLLSRMERGPFALLIQEKNILPFVQELQKTLQNNTGKNATKQGFTISVFFWNRGDLIQFLEKGIARAEEKNKKEKINNREEIIVDKSIEENWAPRVEMADAILEIIHDKKIYLESQAIWDQSLAVGHEFFCRAKINDQTILPFELISIARQNDKIFDLEYQIIEKAIAEIKTRKDKWKEPQTFYINLSRDMIEEEKYQEKIVDLLKKMKDLSQYIHFDLTESTIVHRKEETMRFIQKINQKNLKNRVGLDRAVLSADFLSIICDLPIAHIKISGNVIQKAVERGAEELLLAIIKIAETENIQIIADSIDTEKKLLSARACGIRFFQGKMISEIHRL